MSTGWMSTLISRSAQASIAVGVEGVEVASVTTRGFVSTKETVFVGIERRGVARQGALECRRHLLMPDKRRGVGEDSASGRVIPMVMAVQHVLHRGIEPARDLGLQPFGKVGVDGIAKNHAFWSHQKHGEMIVVSCPVQISRDIGDLANGFRHRLGRRGVPPPARLQGPPPVVHSPQTLDTPAWLRTHSADCTCSHP